MYSYRICGLRVASELALPGAIRQSDSLGASDVSIRWAAVPATLGDQAERGPNWDRIAGTFLLRIPGLARLLVSDGRDIAVELQAGSTECDVSAHVLGTALGILLHQRGTLVLHGAAVARNGAAVVICGRSGAGKSTLAAALCRDGATFVTDDICAIGFDDDRRPLVLPDGRRLKLWQETIERFDFAAQRRDAVRSGLEKYFVDPPSAVAPGPLPLRAVYVLKQARPPLNEGIEAVGLPEAMAMLDHEAYRPAFRARMGSLPAMVAQGGMMLRYARMYHLIHPRGLEKVGETAAAIRHHWDGLAP